MKKILGLVLLSAASASSLNAGMLDNVSNLLSKQDNTAVKTESAPSSGTQALMTTGAALLPLLSQSLNISNLQAEGGLGSLLQAAKSLINNDQFALLAKSIPGIDKLLAAAPTVNNTAADSGMLGSALKMAKQYSASSETGSQLQQQFQSLGLSTDMIPKFTSITSDYLTQNDNAESANVLSSALTKLF